MSAEENPKSRRVWWRVFVAFALGALLSCWITTICHHVQIVTEDARRPGRMSAILSLAGGFAIANRHPEDMVVPWSKDSILVKALDGETTALNPDGGPHWTSGTRANLLEWPGGEDVYIGFDFDQNGSVSLRGIVQDGIEGVSVSPGGVLLIIRKGQEYFFRAAPGKVR